MENIPLKGTKKEIAEIWIDPQDALLGISNALRKKYGIPRDAFLNQDGILRTYDSYQRGCNRKATRDEKRILKALETLSLFIEKDTSNGL